MKAFKLFTLTALIVPLISFGQNEDAWDVYIAEYEKGPGSTLLNMSLKNIAPVAGFPYLLKVGVKFTKCGEEGLPADGELDNLNRISEAFAAVVEKRTRNILAGTFTYQCERNDYYYISDTVGLSVLREELLNKCASRFPGYEPLVTIKEDSKWDAYLSFLYPNEETQEYMSNEKVLLKLQEAGDKLEKERQVDHWIYFATEDGRKCFITYCTGKHFKIESQQKVAGKMRYKLQISRTDKVDLSSISALTLELRKQATKCGGDYDGWETFVIKE